MPFINQWNLSLSGTGVKLKNINTGDIFLLPKGFIMFKPIDPDQFHLFEEATQITLILKMSEFVSPSPGPDLETFLGTLATLISA